VPMLDDQLDRQIAGTRGAVLMMPVELPDRQLAGSWNAVLNAFITNIPNQKIPVDQPDGAAFRIPGCRFHDAGCPIPGCQFSMHLLQISRIR
jgi:hypothetical protein